MSGSISHILFARIRKVLIISFGAFLGGKGDLICGSKYKNHSKPNDSNSTKNKEAGKYAKWFSYSVKVLSSCKSAISGGKYSIWF